MNLYLTEDQRQAVLDAIYFYLPTFTHDERPKDLSQAQEALLYNLWFYLKDTQDGEEE